MRLSWLLKDISFLLAAEQDLAKCADMEIACLATDSRAVEKGSLFIAISGHAADGHDYIAAALDQGAVGVVAEKIPESLQSDEAASRIILVSDTRKALAHLAARFYDDPSRDLVLVGITGTNGKTTTTYLLESIFSACGFVPAVMGTVNIRYQGREFPSPTTTPDALGIQKYLAQMKQSGVTHVIMEVSSHGIDQHRVDSCFFDAVVFTNLTQDHLDYHCDLASYFACKKELFTRIVPEQQSVKSGVAVINVDNEYGKQLAGDIAMPGITVSTHDKEADLYAAKTEETIDGLSGVMKTAKNLAIDFQSCFTGGFNLENILCAAGTAYALGIAPEYITRGISDCRIVPGRLEKVTNTLGRHIFVDYAHTPDALKNVLATLEKNAPGRLICVAGCGGDRDKTKRSPMGKIALEKSDIAIITSDNPRTEDPEKIIEDVIKDLPRESVLKPEEISPDSTPGSKFYLVEPDRKKALNLAVKISRPKDTILAAGKGHETYQIIGTEKIHFDDAEELAAACQTYQEQQISPIEWTIADIARALGTEPVSGTTDEKKTFHSISTDSRSIDSNQVFVALRGEHFDGHSFIDQVLEKGVGVLIVDEAFSLSASICADPSIHVFQVEDTIKALGKLAHFQRMRAGVKVVAITGSNGKTSTKTIVKSILSTRFVTLGTKGNLNNEIGVPMTLLGLSHAHEWAVVEMGMNHPGEISYLSAIAQPDIAVITNTGAAHLEGLGNVENVARAKAEIFDHVNENAVAVLPGRDGRKKILVQAAEHNPCIQKILFFDGPEKDCLEASNVEIRNDLCQFQVRNGESFIPMKLHSLSHVMVNNALVGISVGMAAGLDMEDIRKGVERFQPVPGRMRLVHLPNKAKLIDDTYNANPKSMTAALTSLAVTVGRQKCFAVLGDMMELGSHASQAHYDIGRIAAMTGISRLFLFGTMVELTRKGAIDNGLAQDKIFWGSREDITFQLAQILAPGQWVLVKGSRSMAMETVITQLAEKIEEQMNIKQNQNPSGGIYAV